MAQAAASSVNKEMEISMERLSTGKRINGASDDAAGIAIASRLTAEIKGTNMAIRNAMDGQALIDTAEGAHAEVENILQRMRELAVQSSNGTNDANDRANLQSEMTQLSTEIDRIAGTTAWAGINLLDGATPDTNSLATAHSDVKNISLAVGSGTTNLDSISVNIGALSASALNIGGGTSVPTTATTVAAGGSAGTLAVGSQGALTAAFTFGGTWAAGDTYSADINGQAISITTVDSDGYSNDMEGAARQFADAIIAEAVHADHDQALMGLEVSRNGLVVTAAFGNTSTPAIDITVDNASLTGSGVTDETIDVSTANTITVAGTFGTSGAGVAVISADVNGVTFTATEAADFGAGTVFSADANGAAASLAAKINASVAATPATGNLGNSGIIATADSSGNVNLTRTLTVANTAASGTAGSTTLAESNGTFTVGGTVAVGDVLTAVVEGVTVSATVASSDSYTDDVAGAVAQLAQAITDAGISNVSVSNITGTSFDLEKSNAIDITSASAAQSTITSLDAALQTISAQRANLGAISNRLDSTVSNLTNISSNLQAGRGRIEDADFAAETTSLAKSQILQQASTAMLAQANASKQNVLSLLQG